jgi:hypothetical protein
MQAVAHNPSFAKKAGVPQSVGKDFAEADKGRKFKGGGDVKKELKAAKIFAKAGEKKLAAHERREAAGKEKDTPAIAKKEMSVLRKAKAPKDVMDYESSEHAEMGFKKGGRAKKFGMGGMPMPPDRAMVAPRRPMPPARRAAPARRVAPPMQAMPPMPMAKGGGIESKGKTSTKSVKMAKGGGIESKGKTRGRMC